MRSERMMKRRVNSSGRAKVRLMWLRQLFVEASLKLWTMRP